MNMQNTRLLVGQVASASGVSVDTVRYYERMGLLPPAARTASGYRHYPPQAVARVGLVQRALQFGFSLKELAEFLKARDAGTPPCRAVRDAAERLLGRVEEDLAALKKARARMRRTLRDWDVRLAESGDRAPARLLEALPVVRATSGISDSRYTRSLDRRRLRAARRP